MTKKNRLMVHLFHSSHKKCESDIERRKFSHLKAFHFKKTIKHTDNKHKKLTFLLYRFIIVNVLFDMQLYHINDINRGVVLNKSNHKKI